ncbi:hypothetical protein [Nocardia concava]|uniref:hypothetical protein n=1 Tax=Nocardia concava TaxID=257281 RepID=UPI0002DCD9F7|nr:hypothetical protein [Nocardia concava]
MTPPATYLLILGEREAVAWVLRESRMAFPATHRAEVNRLRIGDRLLVLTTRGCWHNPTRDRTRVIGSAEVTTPVLPYEKPLNIAGRDFTRSCEIDIHQLSPYLTGVELVPLVPQLRCFPDKRAGAWSLRLRRPLLQIDDSDDVCIRNKLNEMSGRPIDLIPEYLAKIRPVAASGNRMPLLPPSSHPG